jgi:uncharacterized membrane protein YeaQ/YmgE (transglycosylase-associated protein family)
MLTDLKALFFSGKHIEEKIMDSNVMGWLAWIIIGGVASWLASIVMKTNARQGLIMDIVVGIIGAIIGGYLFGLVGLSGVTGFNIGSLLVAFIGAVVLLGVLRLLSRRGILNA